MAHILQHAREQKKVLMSTLQKISHQARDLHTITGYALQEGELSYTNLGRLMAELHRSGSMQLPDDFEAWEKLYPGYHSNPNRVSYSHEQHPSIASSASREYRIATSTDHVTRIRCLVIQLSDIARDAEAMVRQVDKFTQEPTLVNFNRVATGQWSLVEAIVRVFLDWEACLELQSDQPSAACNAGAAPPQNNQASNIAVNAGPNENENDTPAYLQGYIYDDDMEDLYEGHA
uniref:Uncharacterized protein n=1 Tax=Branchiostoma floridae TaxID=7739 RepID=C3Z8A1_BRAFL|eukprot:XP_002595213.1 hypothetical protein BRAFLDRAFT_100374 [Branchiostoma floridae]